MIYSASKTSSEFLLTHHHLQTLTIIGSSKQCTEKDSNYDDHQTGVMKEVVLQAHLTPLDCCGNRNHSLALQVLS
jgi:hypothetical protein